jgi:hypothetical protein
MEQELFGKLFNTVPLVDENHLDIILQTLDKNHATYFLIHAVKHAYVMGAFSMGEVEVISKSIRVLSKKESEELGGN